MARPSRYSPEYQSEPFGWSGSTGRTHLAMGRDRVDCEQAGMHAETLRRWCGKPSATPATQRLDDRRAPAIKELEREVRELKRANEILRKASAYFAQAELDRRPK